MLLCLNLYMIFTKLCNDVRNLKNTPHWETKRAVSIKNKIFDPRQNN